MAIPVINQITERVIRGRVGGIDELRFRALTIVRIGLKSATTDFRETLDFVLTDGAVDWSPGGNEPQEGQAYFVTYTFQASSSFKDFDQVSNEMDVNLGALQPEATTQPGSVTRNLFIDLPATQYADVYASIQRVASIQSLNNLEDFQGTELEDFGGNFDFSKGPPRRSTGFATFSAAAIAAEPILVPLGTRIATLSTAIQGAVFFRTIEDGTIFPGQVSVTVPIEAEEEGAIGNVGSNSIVIINTPVLGISTVINQNPTSGGRDEEPDDEYRDRLRSLFLASDAHTFRGIRRRALDIPNVIDALVVGAGDPLLVRGGGVGGKVDLYVQAEAGLSRIATDEFSFSGPDHVFDKQPVLSVSEVLVNGSLLPATAYALVKDFGDLRESTRSQDRLTFFSGVSVGDDIVVDYNHNAVLDDVQEFFSLEENDVPSRDLLVRSATMVFIDVSVTVVLESGFSGKAARDAIVDAVAGFIDNLKLGATIRYRDIFRLVHDVEGVDDIRPIDLLARRGSASAETIQLARNEFPQSGAITVNFLS